jgi:hypothetical protein
MASLPKKGSEQADSLTSYSSSMASSPKKGSERADSLTSAHAPTSSHPTETSEASESSSRGGAAAFIEKIQAAIAASNGNWQGEVQTAANGAIPDNVPRDANGSIVNPGGPMILTRPNTHVEKTSSGQ